MIELAGKEIILIGVLIFYIIPAFITRYLFKKYYPQDFENSIVDMLIYMPFINIVGLVTTIADLVKDKNAWEEAREREKIEKRIEHMETFLRYHGYTWNDVDEFIDSLGVVEKFLEGRKNDSIRKKFIF